MNSTDGMEKSENNGQVTEAMKEESKGSGVLGMEKRKQNRWKSRGRHDGKKERLRSRRRGEIKKR